MTGSRQVCGRRLAICVRLFNQWIPVTLNYGSSPAIVLSFSKGGKPLVTYYTGKWINWVQPNSPVKPCWEFRQSGKAWKSGNRRRFCRRFCHLPFAASVGSLDLLRFRDSEGPGEVKEQGTSSSCGCQRAGGGPYGSRNLEV